ncbi:MAG: outer membrane beta-barrel domain-containing protein [Deltaproteobacteria bacterium]|nr:outer membrane beta-barrel domain-containing protein [Deltaproteobacteria bacterium]
MRSGTRRLAAGLLVVAAWSFGPATPAIAQCIDQEIRDELNARRRYRGVQSRIFQKAGRHELSIFGGIYSADLLSSTWQAGGAYTFHVGEDLGLEASFTYAAPTDRLVRIVENRVGMTLLRDRDDTPALVFLGHLVWSLAYGKMRWFGSGITRFNFDLALGGGVTDDETAAGLTFSGGVGFKLYVAQWLGIRIDVRDHVLAQEVLGETQIVNNVVVSMGLSIFFPFGF